MDKEMCGALAQSPFLGEGLVVRSPQQLQWPLQELPAGMLSLAGWKAWCFVFITWHSRGGVSAGRLGLCRIYFIYMGAQL